MLHAWTLDPSAAQQLQLELRDRLMLTWDGRDVRTVGGVDVSLKEDAAHAAIVVLGYPDLTPLAAATAQEPLTFPYIPGLLSFREAPAVLAAWEQLEARPDLVMIDGQGIAHPRGIGIASHIGLWIERPTIGVAKSRLYGNHAEPDRARGHHTPLYAENDPQRVIGAVVRTRANVKPVFVSPGHLIDVEHSIRFVLDCAQKYRLPEPTGWAHRVAGGATLPTQDSGTQMTLL